MSAPRPVYDDIGRGYSTIRRPDPRIAAQIEAALGKAQSVINVGAGTGSYESADRAVTAVEPSAEMIRQRAPGVAPAVQGSAEQLPFADNSFDAAMAVLTVHHWGDQQQGLREMRRVARGPVVILTYDPDHAGTWICDYLPQLLEFDRQQMPKIADYARALGPVTIAPVPVPHDCEDGFLHAFWRRPAAYLDPAIQRGNSTFHRIDDLQARLQVLADDLQSGAWARRHAHLLNAENVDAGYRLITALPRLIAGTVPRMAR